VFVANNKKNQKQATPPPEPLTRVQRLLLYVGGSIFGLGVVAIFALLIGEALVPISVSNDIGIWGPIAFIPDIGIPLGFIILIALMIITFRRRAQADKGAGK
jgi:nitrate reductase gamma subunit